MLMIAFTVALGVSLATAMMNVMLGVGDKVNKELKTYGANITVMHKDASILDDLYGIRASLYSIVSIEPVVIKNISPSPHFPESNLPSVSIILLIHFL